MLGITNHNPAIITVFLDRLRFKDCFVTVSDYRDGCWEEKLEQFCSYPGDGRERVLFVESFAALHGMLRAGSDLSRLKVAVYDTVENLRDVAGVKIVDSKLDSRGTWQIYTMSFSEFNDLLEADTPGVSSRLVEFVIADEDKDLPLPKRSRTSSTCDAIVGEDSDLSDDESPVDNKLLMETLLDRIDEDDDEDVDSCERELPGEHLTKHNLTGEVVAAPNVSVPPAAISKSNGKPTAEKQKARKSKPKVVTFELF